MKEISSDIRKNLTEQERAFLSRLWDDKDLLRALESALSYRQLILAQQAVGITTDFSQVMFKRGAIEEDRWVMWFLKNNYDELQKPKLNNSGN